MSVNVISRSRGQRSRSRSLTKPRHEMCLIVGQMIFKLAGNALLDFETCIGQDNKVSEFIANALEQPTGSHVNFRPGRYINVIQIQHSDKFYKLKGS